MKNAFLYLAFIFICLTSFQTSFAQAGLTGQEQMAQLQSQIAKLKITYLKEKFILSESQAKEFWPIYEKYYVGAKQDLIKTEERINTTLAKNTNSDEQKLFQMEQNMKTKMNELDQKITFHNKMKEVLSIDKVLEFYSLEKNFEKKLAELLR